MAAVNIAGTWQKSRQNVYFLGSIFIASVTVDSGVAGMHRNLMWYIAGQENGRRVILISIILLGNAQVRKRQICGFLGSCCML
jgi:hypothetical protein